jgi:hypothetical protein
VRVVSAIESATAPLGAPVVSLPVVRFDHNHQPIIAATMRSNRIKIHGAPRFFSSILISATLPSLECDVFFVATNVPRSAAGCKGFLHELIRFPPEN